MSEQTKSPEQLAAQDARAELELERSSLSQRVQELEVALIEIERKAKDNASAEYGLADKSDWWGIERMCVNALANKSTQQWIPNSVADELAKALVEFHGEPDDDMYPALRKALAAYQSHKGCPPVTPS